MKATIKIRELFHFSIKIYEELIKVLYDIFCNRLNLNLNDTRENKTLLKEILNNFRKIIKEL